MEVINIKQYPLLSGIVDYVFGRKKEHPIMSNPSQVITPTVGRVVHFYMNNKGPMAALIAYVHDDRHINVAWFDSMGNAHGEMDVVLRQPGEDVPGNMCWAEWMPYQIKKDTGSESGERASGTQVIGGVEYGPEYRNKPKGCTTKAAAEPGNRHGDEPFKSTGIGDIGGDTPSIPISANDA